MKLNLTIVDYAPWPIGQKATLRNRVRYILENLAPFPKKRGRKFKKAMYGTKSMQKTCEACGHVESGGQLEGYYGDGGMCWCEGEHGCDCPSCPTCTATVHEDLWWKHKELYGEILTHETLRLAGHSLKREIKREQKVATTGLRHGLFKAACRKHFENHVSDGTEEGDAMEALYKALGGGE